MIYTLEYKTSDDIKRVTSKDLRSFVLSKIENRISNDDMKKVLFHLDEKTFQDKQSRKISYIFFSKTSKNHFRLKAINPDGLDLLLKIKDILDELKSFDINNTSYKILSVNVVINELIPKKTEDTIAYKTITPILLFKGNRRKIYDAIYFKHKDNKEAFNEEIKNSTNKMIRASIKNLLCTFVKRKDYKMIDDINIDWKEFKVIMITDRDMKTPAIVGRFESSWDLPHLLGNRLGYGFGHIRKDFNANSKKRSA